MVDPYVTQFVRPTPFGTLAAVSLPSGFEPVADDVVARLTIAERAEAQTHHGRRQIEFVGGRLAWHAAGGVGDLLSGVERMPVTSAPLSVSITHKDDVALALVAPASSGTLGLDLEGGGREPLNIASRVLRPEELAEFEALPEAQKWPYLMLRFAVKEATYKAIFPHVRRFVSFDEASVSDAPLTVVMHLEPPPERPLRLEARVERWEARVIAMVRAQSD